MRRRGLPFRRLGLESLECRSLLAGIVNVELVDGQLAIWGDDRANNIEVHIDPVVPGRVRLAAGMTPEHVHFNPAANSYETRPTQIVTTTGIIDEPGKGNWLIFDGVEGIQANLGGGNDLVRIRYGTALERFPRMAGEPLENAPLLGRLSVDLGEGDDYLFLGHTEIGLITHSVGLQESFVFYILEIAGDLDIDTGAGHDLLAALVDVDGQTNVESSSSQLEEFWTAVPVRLNLAAQMIFFAPPMRYLDDTEPLLPTSDEAAEVMAAPDPPPKFTSTCDYPHIVRTSANGTEFRGTAIPEIGPLREWQIPTGNEEPIAMPPDVAATPLTADAYFLALASGDDTMHQRRRR